MGLGGEIFRGTDAKKVPYGAKIWMTWNSDLRIMGKVCFSNNTNYKDSSLGKSSPPRLDLGWIL
jgi:hypothetical protein